MANDTLGAFFGRLSEKAHDRAKEERDKADKSRQEEIGIWKGVLDNPASSDEQRQKAVDNLNKLYNWKGKGDSPFQKLVGFMKHVGNSLQNRQQAAGGAPQAGAPQAGGGQPGDNQPTDQNAQPKTTGAKGNIASKAIGKLASGLGAGLGVVSYQINPHPKELPPLNAADMPSGAQEDKQKLGYLDKELAIRNKYALEQIKARGEEQLKTARARASTAMQSKVRIPGNALSGAFPKDQQSDLIDESGLPIDPNGIYAPTDGNAAGVEMVDGKPTVHVVRLGTGPARESEYGTWMIDTTKDPPQLVEVPTHRESNVPKAPQKATKDTGQNERPSTLPPLKSGDSTQPTKPKTLSPLKPAGGKDNFHRAPTGFVRPQQFNQLQKQATSTDEARNSLIGDDPKQVAGLMADLDVFNNPQSVERIRNYLGFIEKNIGSTAVGKGEGLISGAEWYLGLPTAISNLQQKAQQELAEKLQPDEQRFISDYFRVMGTIGGMRSSTGAPAARWSFQTLWNELPTPGVVVSRADAQRRITNLIQETNVVAKRNPLSEKIDVNKSQQDNLNPKTRKILEKHGIIPAQTNATETK